VPATTGVLAHAALLTCSIDPPDGCAFMVASRSRLLPRPKRVATSAASRGTVGVDGRERQRGVHMRTITAHRFAGRREEPVRVGVVIEGFAALLGLVAFIGALCGLVTWALIQVLTAVIS
jgi:hypothetical protein